jgi:hypothetical protein
MARIAIMRYCGECGSPTDDRARCRECGHRADPVASFVAVDGATRPLAVEPPAGGTDAPGTARRTPRRRIAQAAVRALAAVGAVVTSFLVLATIDPARPARLSGGTPPVAFELPPGLAALEPRSADARAESIPETTAPVETTSPPSTTPPTTAPSPTSVPATGPPTTTPPVTTVAPPGTVPPTTTPTTPPTSTVPAPTDADAPSAGL